MPEPAYPSWGDHGLPDAASLMSLLDGLPVMLTAVEGPELRLVAMSAPVRAESDRSDWLGERLDVVYPELVLQGPVGMVETVYRTGQPVTVPEWRLEFAASGGGADSELWVTWMLVPWVGPDGSTRGVINVAYDVTDQVLARRRAEQQAADAGQRYRQALDVVLELQQALLPTSTPVLPRVDTAARYLVAGAEQAAGGDWFDVRPLPDGRVALIVGDVVGHGVAAAAAMSQLRAVLAEAVQATGDPVAAADRLDRFVEVVPGARWATVVVAVLDPLAGVLEYVTRGHPAPLLVTRDGEGRQLLSSGDGALGTGPGGRAQQTAVSEGDVVVLFTDGLVERPDVPYAEGLDELTRLAGAATIGQLWPSGTSSSAAERICNDAVELMTRRGYHDDVTVVAARVLPPVADLRRSFRPDAEEVPRMRAAVRAWLTELGPAEADVLALELAVGEAVDNAVEHGFHHLASGSVVVDMRMREDGRVAVRIDDDGMWRPPGSGSSVRGRGLGLIDSLGEDLQVAGEPTGTTVSFSRRVSRPVRPAAARGAVVPVTVAGPAEPFHAVVAGDPPVVHVRGPVDALTADRLREVVRASSRGGAVPLDVDLARTSHLTSVGVAVLGDLLATDSRSRLIAPTGTPAAFVLDLVGLPRHPPAARPGHLDD